MIKVIASFALFLVCVAVRTNGSDSPPPDPRLGPPFVKRERAALGSETARVVVIEFSSFTCTHCRSFHDEIFPRLRERYVDTGKVQWLIINASNVAGDKTSPIYLVARGALQQGRYWGSIDSLYQAGQGSPGLLAALSICSPPTCDGDFEAIQHDPSVREAVAADFSEYAALGIRGTPTFLLRRLGRDGRWTRGLIEDTQTLDYFQRVLDGLLKEP